MRSITDIRFASVEPQPNDGRAHFHVFLPDGSGGEVVKALALGLGWRPVFVYGEIEGTYIVDLEADRGETAFWLLDQEFNFISDRVEGLSKHRLLSCCRHAAAMMFARDLRELPSEATNGPLLEHYLKLSAEVRAQLLRASWRVLNEEIEASRPKHIFSHFPSNRIVSLCLSGHPRVFLNYRETWREVFAQIRSKFDLRIFFHSWSDVGLVKSIGGRFVEGKYEVGRYSSFDELIAELNPTKFLIEAESPELQRVISEFEAVRLSRDQAPKANILSQLYSIESADRIRRAFEQTAATSDAVFKARFDIVPERFHLDELEYIVEHPGVPILFAPSPHSHRHGGGGAGCRACNAIFTRIQHDADLKLGVRDHLSRHSFHTNDICDLYSISNPEVMTSYASLFSRSTAIWRDIQTFTKLSKEHDHQFAVDAGDLKDRRLVNHAVDLEQEVHCFYPEKLIRFGVRDIMIVDSDLIFHIMRR